MEISEHTDLKSRLSGQWAVMADEWIAAVETRGDRNAHREGLLDSWMLAAVGDAKGLAVIDLGCGEGRFSRMLAERGARITGLDLSERFIEYAAEHRARDEEYILGDMEALSGIGHASFDLAVSYLTLVDVPDYESAIGEAFRVLRPKGRLVVCDLQPMTSAAMGWIRHGFDKLHYKLDDYFDEGERVLRMMPGDHKWTNLHRTLSSYPNAFLEAGFALEGIKEPKPTAEQVARFPYIANNLRVPEFIIYLLSKP